MRRLDSIRRSILRAKMRVGVSEERSRITKEDYLKSPSNGKVSYRKWLEYQEDDANEAVTNLTNKKEGIDFRKVTKEDITLKGKTFYAGDKRYKWISHGVFIDLLNPEYEKYEY